MGRFEALIPAHAREGQMIEGKRAVVTGGAGFLGSWLCERLLVEGCEVVCVDNLGSGVKSNVDHLLSNPKFEFLGHDVTKPLRVEGRVDYVYHLASRASPADFEGHAIDILLTNSLGTYNMLKLAREKGARFLLASSSEVYGDPQVHPQPEHYWGNVNPVGPRSCYNEGKRFSEALTMSFHEKRDLDVRIARIFNTYGPRMRPDDGRVVSTFIVQALRGEPITVFGDGSQTRAFCHVSDMVEGLTRLMLVDGLAGEVVNLGSQDEMKIIEIAELIKELTGSSSEITFKPLPKNDPKRRNPDTSKAKSFLGWTPTVTLNEGLKETIEYFKRVIG